MLAFSVAFGAPLVAAAAPCADLDPVNPVYGSGGSAVTATMAAVATALVSLPEEERVTVFFNDPGACTGYGSFITPTAGELTFKYWDANGVQATCQAPISSIQFAHMGNTPALCGGGGDVPAGFAKFVAPVQTINFITHPASSQNAISAEALYHIFKFGAGAEDRSIAPWTVRNSIYARSTTSFVHQIIAGALGISAGSFNVNSANVLGDNPGTVAAVYSKGQSSTPHEPLGYVSGSAADTGEKAEPQQVKTLAYQHFGQSAAYLPDSTRIRKDKINVRSGQYYLWTPAWFYAKVDGSGEILDPVVEKLVRWFDGTGASPDGVEIQELIIASGDIPLCAMHAIRPEGDLSPIQSYAPSEPCNGYFEFVATGSTNYTPCDDDSQCAGEDEDAGTNEICSYGYCELTWN